ncbi:MAG: hypothetical protein AB8B74_12095 [Crocinitomicaceae bacterium]
MTRILFSSILFMMLLTSSCQKCKQCSYSYTKIEIVSSPNGESEEQTTVYGNLEDGDFTTATATEQECIKRGEEFTIEERYKIEESTSEEVDFEYVCTDA